MKIPIYLLGLLINVSMAWLHNQLRLAAIKKGTKAISHGWWGLLYCGLCSIPLIWIHDFYFVGSLVMVHLSAFPVALNTFAGIYPFSLSKTSTAITDRMMVSLGLKDTEIVNVAAQLVSFTLLLISILK